MSGGPSEAERWQRVKALLQETLERPEARRAAWLLAAESDPALRAEVESLLAAHADAPSFLEDSAGARIGLNSSASSLIKPSARDPESADSLRRQSASDHESPDHESPGPGSLGPYRLLRVLGHGGMGTVYLAERDDGLHRQVALKLITHGMASDAVLRRFELEREILARLEHPNIAPLYDGGTSADGRPYFVMKAVDGEPIDRYCERRALDVDQRLKLFLIVCGAVEYAHRNLVVHRDLKPANILVGANGEPMLLDFGIAKVLGDSTVGPGAPTVDLTALARPFTPEYASPEQIRGGTITTASDVFGLGVVLFQLLSGRLPRTFRGSPLEMLRTIEGDITIRPSAALDARPAAERAPLRRRLRGDLDNIVLRALETEPARRYPSVEALADDVRRHLNGMPVRARPSTLAYRARKFIGRHRAGVGLAALAAAALIAATAVAVRQERRAAQRFQEVRALAHSFLFEFHDAIEDLPGATAARELLVKRGLEYLDRLASEAGDDPSLLEELAEAYRKMGDVQGAARAASLGHSPEALLSYQKALAIEQRLAAVRPSDPALRLALADLENRIGAVEAMQGKTAEALARRQRALAAVQELWETEHYAPARREWIIDRVALSEDQWDSGDREGSTAGYRAALAAAEARLRDEPTNHEARRHVGVIEQRLGDSAREMGRWDEELVHDRASLAVDEALAKETPGSAETERDLATDHVRIAVAEHIAGHLDAALAEQRQALGLRESLRSADPQDSRARIDLAESLGQIAGLESEAGQHGPALESWHRALALRRDQMASDPTNAHWGDQLASDLEDAGAETVASGNRAAGLASLREAVALRQRIAAATPDFTENNVHTARLDDAMGRALAAPSGPPGAEACGWFERSSRAYRQLSGGTGLIGDDAKDAATASRDAARCGGG